MGPATCSVGLSPFQLASASSLPNNPSTLDILLPLGFNINYWLAAVPVRQTFAAVVPADLVSADWLPLAPDCNPSS